MKSSYVVRPSYLYALKRLNVVPTSSTLRLSQTPINMSAPKGRGKQQKARAPCERVEEEEEQNEENDERQKETFVTFYSDDDDNGDDNDDRRWKRLFETSYRMGADIHTVGRGQIFCRLVDEKERATMRNKEQVSAKVRVTPEWDKDNAKLSLNLTLLNVRRSFEE